MATNGDKSVRAIRVERWNVPRSELIPCLEKSETNAVRMAIPAEGPSFPIDPSLRMRPVSLVASRLETMHSRHVKVNRSLGQEVGVGIVGESEGEGVRLEEGQGDLGRLLDDLS